jgi:acyl-CoA thioesterase
MNLIGNHFSIQPNDYFLYQTRCMVHADSKSLNLGKMWTKDGKLVATFVQDALIEPKPESKM